MPRFGRPSKSIALWAAFSLLGCTSRRQLAGAHDPIAPDPIAPVAIASDAGGDAASVAPLTDTRDGVLSVTDPDVLQALEGAGMTFGEMIAGPENKGVTNDVLSRSTRYAALAKTIERDVDDLRRADPNAGVSVAQFSHRLFDVRWLRSPAARFELVAVVNRIDRAGIVGGCGEVRFVYRLAYTVQNGGTSIASRLPMTVSFEMNQLGRERGDCKGAADRWFAPSSDKSQLAAWLLSEKGPLSSGQLKIETLRRLAVNVQSVRWPSTVRPDLGAEYILRTFVITAKKGLVSAPLENTPDIAKIRRELMAWIKSNLGALDAATATLPDEFLSSRAVSVTPRGLGRKANRPFSSILGESEFSGLAWGGMQNARSAAALLRRLDDLT